MARADIAYEWLYVAVTWCALTWAAFDLLGVIATVIVVAFGMLEDR